MKPIKLSANFKEITPNKTEGIDLFQTEELIPANVMEILNKYREDLIDGSYSACSECCKELEAIGYTFDWYLDGEPFDLRPIGTKGRTETL